MPGVLNLNCIDFGVVSVAEYSGQFGLVLNEEVNCEFSPSKCRA